MGERERFFRFLVVGGTAAGVNVLSGIALGRVIPYEYAIALAYLVGMNTAFFLSRLLVFLAAVGRIRWQYLRFALINVLAFAQVWLVSITLAHGVLPWLGWTWRTETIAHIVGVISPILTSYCGHRKFSFR